MEKEDLFKKGKKTTITAALATMFFAVAKGVVGFISGSVALIADAIHSLADSLSAFFVWLGLKIAQKKPTEKFPYGFYKAENITSLFISFLILFAGYEIIKESISRLTDQVELNIPLIAMAVALLDAGVMFFVGSYEIKVGRKINSQSLVADGKESRMHIFSSLMVFIGVLSAWLGVAYLEGAVGILISLFIFKVGFDSIKDSIFALMDVSPSRDIEKKIEKILKNISGIKAFDNLKLRKSGPFIFGEVRARVGKEVSVKRAHEISDRIEGEIKKKVGLIDSFVINISPFQVEKVKICIPVDEDNGLSSNISNHFGRAKHFIFLEADKREIKNHYIKKNPHYGKKVRAGLNAALYALEEKIDLVITKEVGLISFHTLRDNIVDVYITKEDIVNNAVKKFFNGDLKILKEPTKEKL
ncbi:MAG: cation diffusion facilitator family transporter [Candidatus Portnoybacteria bacterium]|nr:cation diffusion facilitator family transporter [Candidatus Portnoybacteria bacterium]